jgi:hypothetical protein
MADFDGDHKPDLATLGSNSEDNSPFIEVQLGTTNFPVFTLLIRGSGNRLRARDLDGDNDRDLVLETALRVPLAVWINDGAGNFQQGNLESFRFQLSHDDPTSLGSYGRPLLPHGAECPRRNAALSSLLERAPEPAGARLLATPQTSPAAPNHFDIWTRGPPISR